MAEPPPRDPQDPDDDETVIVPPGEPVDETVVQDDWGPETVVASVGEEVVVEETAPPRKPPTLWPWLLALLLLVLLGLGAFYLLSRDDDDEQATTTAATTQAAERTVPDVVGTTSSEATATLREAGFEANLVSVPSDRPPGTVVAQDPAPGTTQSEGTSVRLNVAEEAQGATTGATTTGTTTTGTTTAATTAPPPQPSPAVVPDVVGDELADAGRSFADEGLKVSAAYVPSQEPSGRVIAQAQSAGTELERGATVQINVSTGPDPAAGVAVPNVTGRTLDEARQALDAAGFEVLALSPSGVAVKNSSPVESQTPAGGATIPRGLLVLVYV